MTISKLTFNLDTRNINFDDAIKLTSEEINTLALYQLLDLHNLCSTYRDIRYTDAKNLFIKVQLALRNMQHERIIT
jgi:hypothetical protein